MGAGGTLYSCRGTFSSAEDLRIKTNDRFEIMNKNRLTFFFYFKSRLACPP